MPVLKRALIRDAGYPQGVSAPMHVVCECGDRVPIKHQHNTCGTCGTIYDDAGWIRGTRLVKNRVQQLAKDGSLQDALNRQS